MKKIIHVLILLTLSYSVFAQTKPQPNKTGAPQPKKATTSQPKSTGKVQFKEGVAEFTITYPSLTEEMKKMEAMFPKSISVYFKNEFSRFEMHSAMGNTISIGNSIKKDIVVMTDMMGQKIAVKQTEDDLKKKEDEMKKEGTYPTFTVTPSKETKMIAGYLCKKAIISYTVNGKTEKLNCYYTEALPQMTGGDNNPAFKQINGFLMEYNLNYDGLEMRIQAQSVKKQPVANTMFSIPSDYKIMTPEEIAEMMGGATGK